MIERLSKNKRNVALAVLAVLVIWFSWTVRSVLNPLVLGYMLATILHPMVEGVERTGWSRRAAVNVIFILFSLVFLGIGFGVYVQGRMLVRDVFESNVDVFKKVEDSFDDFVEEHSFLANWLADEPVDGDEPVDVDSPADGEPTQDPPEGDPPEGQPDEEEGADQGAQDAGSEGEEDLPGEKQQDEQQYLRELLITGWQALSKEQAGAGMALKGAGTMWSLLQRWFGSILGFATLVTMLPLYTYFLLFELDKVHGFVRRYLPVGERKRLTDIARQIGEVLANFFRGRLTICFLKGMLLTTGMWIADIPYALLLGMGSGFLALVPFVGPLIGFVIAFTIGFLPENVTFLSVLVRTGLVFVIAEILEGYILVPKILGDSLGLHPVVVLVSVFVGGAALGMFGFLIAIPLTASLVIIARELVMPALAQFADEEPEAEAVAVAAPESEPEPEPEPDEGKRKRRRRKKKA
ncbi:MAG: AI-2E family transporter [bacterium]|nr:AI-2E family transporter [bacterium]